MKSDNSAHSEKGQGRWGAWRGVHKILKDARYEREMCNFLMKGMVLSFQVPLRVLVKSLITKRFVFFLRCQPAKCVINLNSPGVEQMERRNRKCKCSFPTVCSILSLLLHHCCHQVMLYNSCQVSGEKKHFPGGIDSVPTKTLQWLNCRSKKMNKLYKV